jgi:hypothetical protein
MASGRIAGELSGPKITEDAILRLAMELGEKRIGTA